MTRINVEYPVEKFTTKHLIVEHRKIKRIPNTIVSGKAVVKDIPETFRIVNYRRGGVGSVNWYE